MSHEEFWKITPGELNERATGYEWRKDLVEQRWASACANVMNATGRMKTVITAEMLLGRKLAAEPDIERYADVIKESRARVKKAKQDANTDR